MNQQELIDRTISNQTSIADLEYALNNAGALEWSDEQIKKAEQDLATLKRIRALLSKEAWPHA